MLHRTLSLKTVIYCIKSILTLGKSMRKFVAINILLILCLTISALGYAAPVDLTSNMAMLHEKTDKMSDKETFSIVVMGDNRSGDRIYENILKDINAKKPLFIAHAGDKTYTGMEKEYKKFVQIHETNNISFFSVAGNHEMRFGNDERYIKYFGDKDFSFDIGSNAFIFVDSTSGLGNSSISESSLKLFDEACARYKDKRIFVIVHHPSFDPIVSHKSPKIMESKSLAKFNAILDKYKVRYVFYGHNHVYGHRSVNGRDEYITGGAGSPLYAKPEEGGYYHYLWIDITKNDVNISVIKYENK